jgi:hypothetical protein
MCSGICKSYGRTNRNVTFLSIRKICFGMVFQQPNNQAMNAEGAHTNNQSMNAEGAHTNIPCLHVSKDYPSACPLSA